MGYILIQAPTKQIPKKEKPYRSGFFRLYPSPKLFFAEELYVIFASLINLIQFWPLNNEREKEVPCTTQFKDLLLLHTHKNIIYKKRTLLNLHK